VRLRAAQRVHVQVRDQPLVEHAAESGRAA